MQRHFPYGQIFDYSCRNIDKNSSLYTNTLHYTTYTNQNKQLTECVSIIIQQNYTVFVRGSCKRNTFRDCIFFLFNECIISHESLLTKYLRNHYLTTNIASRGYADWKCFLWTILVQHLANIQSDTWLIFLNSNLYINIMCFIWGLQN